MRAATIRTLACWQSFFDATFVSAANFTRTRRIVMGWQAAPRRRYRSSRPPGPVLPTNAGGAYRSAVRWLHSDHLFALVNAHRRARAAR